MFKVFVADKSKLCVCQCIFVSERKDKDDKNQIYCWDIKGVLPSGRVEPLKSCNTLDEARQVVLGISDSEKLAVV